MTTGKFGLLRQLGSRWTKFGNSPRITVLKFGAFSLISVITVLTIVLLHVVCHGIAVDFEIKPDQDSSADSEKFRRLDCGDSIDDSIDRHATP